MRRYDDPVEVRRGQVTGAEMGAGLIEGPEQFLWRGRLWKVRRVLARWVETGAWWQSTEVRAALGTDEGARIDDRIDGGIDGGAAVTAVRGGIDLLGERELWRVEAGRGGLESDGVFELCFDWSDGRWQLVGCVD